MNARWPWMSRFAQKVAMVCSLAVLCVTMLMPAQVALAAPRCSGASCRGRDPQQMGCTADARTLSISPIPGTAGAGWNEVVELRYSPRCNARWSRVTSRLAAADIVFTTAYLAGIPATRITRTGTVLVWSRMWTGGASACGLSVWSGDPSYRPLHCTP